MVPVVASVTDSPSTRPLISTSLLVSAVPSYSFSSEPVVTVAAFGVTVSAPTVSSPLV